MWVKFMAISAGKNKPKFWSTRNIFYQSYRLKNRPELIIGLAALCFLSFVVLVPLLQIIKDALTFQSYDLAYEPDGVVGEFTLFHLDRVFNQPISAALFLQATFKQFKNGFCCNGYRIIGWVLFGLAYGKNKCVF